MRMFVALLIVVSFLIAGCASMVDKPVEVYTFKKERVDQTIAGNQGYMEGTPPAVDRSARDTKRTLIGIDIELPGGSIEDADQTASAQKVAGPTQVRTLVVEKESVTVDKGGNVTVTETVIEDEWIK
ncbi:MAG: hypothetical protein HQ594_07210 [Candidatus Omnitrophica bacterium]|nr:hypothetical protein [Candidatus Omnitrophota bacterium]